MYPIVLRLPKESSTVHQKLLKKKLATLAVRRATTANLGNEGKPRTSSKHKTNLILARAAYRSDQ